MYKHNFLYSEKNTTFSQELNLFVDSKKKIFSSLNIFTNIILKNFTTIPRQKTKTKTLLESSSHLFNSPPWISIQLSTRTKIKTSSNTKTIFDPIHPNTHCVFWFYTVLLLYVRTCVHFVVIVYTAYSSCPWEVNDVGFRHGVTNATLIMFGDDSN